MKIDVKRVAASALEAALNEEPEPPHRLRGVRTLAAGAALVTAARMGEKHMPRLSKLRLFEHAVAKLEDVGNLPDLADAVRERFSDYVHHDDDAGDAEDYEDEDYEEEGEDGEDDWDEDAPSDESDEDEPERDQDGGEPSDANGDDAPRGDDNEESQPEAAGNVSDDEGEQGREGPDSDTPDLVDALSEHHSRPPVMERMAEDLDPAARAPQAVERLADDRSSRSRGATRSGSNRNKQSTPG